MINHSNFKDKNKVTTEKLVSYYEGDQLRFVKDILNGKVEGMGARKDWKERGFIPRTRNITKSIIDKSGLLLNKPPKLEVWKDGVDTPVIDETFLNLMYNSDWLEFFQNVDVYTRLLKTTVVLAQKYLPNDVDTINGQYRYNEERGDALVLTLLHQGNSCIKQDIARNITELAYLIDPDPEWIKEGDDKKEVWYYRLITPESITDIRVESGMGQEEKESIVNGPNVNPEGIVPAVVFYDINRPRKGVWCRTPEDLVSLQEFYNLHLTDQEFAIAHQKQKTLFVDTEILGDDDNMGVIPYAPLGHTPASEVYSDLDAISGSSGTIGGLGKVVTLKNDGSGKSPFVEFKGPDSNLGELDEIAKDLVVQVAYDWDVNLRVEGSGQASSGFQLVVEEMNNLQLREKRAQSMQAGFRKFYNIINVMYPELTDGVLLVEFAPPTLPVDFKSQEETWSLKIAEGRGSRVDYFIEVHQMSRDEAENKVKEIDAYRAQFVDDTTPILPDFTEE